MTREKQRRPHVLAYDSEDQNRRARALRACQAYSLDPQYSVHELSLSPGEANTLWRRLKQFATPPDRILLIARDARLTTQHLRTKPTEPETNLRYLG